jgi:hypothetical protein
MGMKYLFIVHSRVLPYIFPTSFQLVPAAVPVTFICTFAFMSGTLALPLIGLLDFFPNFHCHFFPPLVASFILVFIRGLEAKCYVTLF